MIRWCTVPEIWRATDVRADRPTDGRMDEQDGTRGDRRTDRQTDGKMDRWIKGRTKKKATYRSGCLT